ncbi:MAG: IclR family transcriptional regulator [Flavobacteriaceae bacterium]
MGASGPIATQPGAPSHVKSAVRTLQILEYFDQMREPATAATLSKMLRYPQSSTSALLKSMVAMGYLEFDNRRRTYFPTSRVALIGSWLNPALFAEGNLVRLVQAIFDRTGQLVLLAARNGDHAQYIHVMHPQEDVPKHIIVGVTRPLATSAVGQALLSAHDDAEIRQLLHRINAYRPGGETPVQISTLLRTIADVRREGWATSLSQLEKGTGIIAMLLPIASTGRPLAIGLAGRSETLSARRDELIHIMHEEIDRFLSAPKPSRHASRVIEQEQSERMEPPHVRPGDRRGRESA